MSRPKRPLLYHRRFRELPKWTPDQVRKLRYHLGFSQQQMAEELGVRGRETIAEWENAIRHPRRTSRYALTILAAKGRFPIGV